MNADNLALALIVGTAPPTTLFVLIYGFTSRWWETMIGRALLISSAGLASLVDIALLYQWLGDDYALRDFVRVTVYSLIFLGAWLKFIALALEKYRAYKCRGEGYISDDC